MMLVVHGGPDGARRRFSAEGRGDWSQAFPAVLEKHGYLDFEARAAASVTAAELAAASCVVVARLAATDWTDPLRAFVGEGTAPVLLEGPLPAELHALAGVRSAVAAPVAPMTVGVTDAALRAAAERYGHRPGGRLEEPAQKPLPRAADQEWQTLPAVAITPAQADAWAARGWDVESWELEGGTEVLARWRGETAQPAVVRRGRVLATSFSVLAYLGQAHTAPPWPSGLQFTSPRTMGLEAMVLGLLDGMHQAAGVARARVLPWPRGVRWALTVRHDFDRPLSPATVAGIVDRHRLAGTAATWYWRSRHLDRPPGLRNRRRRQRGREALRIVAAAERHEVALHTERLFTAGAEQERAVVERVADTSVTGTCAHGDPTCFRFQGAPNVLWAERGGMRYTELLQHAHFHPHRFVQMAPDGSIAPGDVVCLPHHESYDLSMKSGHTGSERVLSMAEAYGEVGGLMQVMNHPDLNVPELFETLRALPRAGRWDCTADEVARWWRATHATDRLSLRVDGDRIFARAAEPVRGLVLEVLLPDGERRSETVDALPDGVVPLVPAGTAHG